MISVTLVDLLLNIPKMIYYFYNIKNIKFKEWIYDILKGYKISRKYEDSSIFIKRSWFYHSTPPPSPASSHISSMSSETLESFTHDYSSSDEYMRNYKQKYVINNRNQ